eukprot:m.184752 g.184752  ORF g.184752 m.184752 type:complete len:268 (-) comp16210_c0_seq1:214-1017(-)
MLCTLVWRTRQPLSTAAASVLAARRAAHTVTGPCEVSWAGLEAGGTFCKSDGSPASPWHDIPLFADKAAGTLHFVNEIPRYTTAKMEIATSDPYNPIVQDTNKDGTPRHYHGPLFWNYGCLPQTWEDPRVESAECGEGVLGDNDPLDVVEIGSATIPMGEVRVVKAIGVFSMIDSGELDWKVIAIDVEDPLASKINDVKDVEALLPGTISGIREWFRWYKTPDGKALNAFGHNEAALDRDMAYKVIAETHHHWHDLMANPMDGLWTS